MTQRRFGEFAGPAHERTISRIQRRAADAVDDLLDDDLDQRTLDRTAPDVPAEGRPK